jgi:hypothetical protein
MQAIERAETPCGYRVSYPGAGGRPEVSWTFETGSGLAAARKPAKRDAAFEQEKREYLRNKRVGALPSLRALQAVAKARIAGKKPPAWAAKNIAAARAKYLKLYGAAKTARAWDRRKR